jgi:hypothetical protein
MQVVVSLFVHIPIIETTIRRLALCCMTPRRDYAPNASGKVSSQGPRNRKSASLSPSLRSRLKTATCLNV